ncbi:hypothetical protein [Lacibacter sediminis]|uniref:Uncharacterized protein n=1 Tax=Lacibacter sediminis TaxID=2760713 RepID=A0A7G5XGP0_9BACT|nr:hypothetical protein [Lacibacter sediminis]QNA44643.1 hypothetical protein H4075_00150 [Lacibacter sediminis]
MKNYLLLLFFCSLSLLGKSQVVTGVYKGKMVSDSLKYSVDFELTLKEKNGELYGYCQRLFLIDDVLYYNLVKVKARIKDSVLIVEDEKSVSNNFEEKRKGIKTVYMFNIKDIVDTASVLYGDWSTSSWRNLYAMPGKLVVNRERNYLATQLYKRLEEKKLTKEMMFDEPKPVLVSTPTQPQPTDVVVNKPSDNKPTTTPSTQNKPEVKTAKDSIVTTTVAVIKPAETKPKLNDVAVNQTTDKPITNPVINKPVVTPAKDSTNKTNVAANNPQLPATKPTDVAANQTNNKPATTTAIQNQPTVSNNKPVSTNNNNTVAANPIQQQNKPVVSKPTDSTNKTSVAVNNPQQTKPQQTTVAVNQPNNKPPVTTAPQTQPPVTTNPVVTNQQQAKPQQTGPAVTTSKPNTTPATTNPQQNTSAAANKPVEQKPTTPVVVTAPATNQPTQTKISTIGNVNAGNTATQPQAGTGKPPVINNPVIVKRQVEIIEALEVSEDSVVLSLYDNGEIDGDTVSVFLNNELIVSRIGIKASAYKKTIAVPKGEILQLTLFAENLGSIPPNTGLLIVTTTNERYQVNFSSTLNKSSSIVLKRKE